MRRRNLRQLSYRLLGELVAERLNRREEDGSPDPYGPSAVQKWLEEPSTADAEVAGAIAELAGWDPGWVYYGARSAAPRPPEFDAESVTRAEEEQREVK